ncbi:1-acyl-sn-glycerol-3-phosphate acyltransferase [Erythrobacter sp. HL-111]|uniref:lysophospholipid acyltransferase family protein n=1 Tax=Erythrobacter sp. HL-111 TaxID=1798193 RepID=UPI0006D9ACD1|nr:lysophospholipid acyltransferase family protein [Erythrobacter sp. HL-111]KPP88488.1 MAG: 1-acyl-sn-glycerol-3-phosphate acyltransferase [Erythrobacteraceae bacterium HL-111]SDS20232.1 lyso-ornithine lipid acyltransferase [Erythrobacter sp. HL-111]
MTDGSLEAYAGPAGDAAQWDLRVAAARGEKTPIAPMGWVRVMLRASALLGLMLVFVPLHYAFRLFAYGSPFPMLFLRYAARVSGARVEVIGTHLKRDVFYVANHVSWVDILALAGASGTAFVAKAELAQAPLVGWLASLNRTVFVKREHRLGVAEQINALKEALADNWSVTVFPEGTTTDGQSLLPFKTSMLSVLEPPPPGVLVQPVLLDYGPVAEWIGWIGEESGLNNAKRVLARRGSFPLRIQFLEPFSPEDFRGRKAISVEARRRIEEALEEALGKPLRDFAHDVPPVRYEGRRAGESAPETLQ